MEEKQHKPTFAEMVAQWTGRPVNNRERKPLTEEELRKGRELTEKMRSLSKEERLKQFKETQFDDWTNTEQDK